jgi:hypothetical protein
MRHEAKGTLAYYSAAPHFQPASLTHVRCKELASAINSYKANSGKATPEQEAAAFYGMNHVSGMIRKRFTPYEKLPDWAVDLMDAYLMTLSGQSTRLFYYLVLIATREARHLKSMSEGWWKTVESKYGPGYVQFAKGMQGSESAAMSSFLGGTLNLPLLMYMEAISYTFRKGHFSSAYGGPKWADISDVVVRFLSGETSIEVLCDTAFTLAHNTAPIFNKPLLYNGQQAAELLKVLDVQRAGMVPSGILSGELEGTNNAALAGYMAVARDEMGDIPPVVDWAKVKALGAKGYYPHKVVTPPPVVGPPKWLPQGAKVVGPWMVSPKEHVVQYKRK